MRRATIIRKHRGRARRTSAPLYPVTSAQPPRAPHRLSVPAIVESLSTHRFIEQQRARNAAKNLALDDERSLYKSSSRLTTPLPTDTPSSYGSLFSQIQENSSDCEGLHDFISRTYRVLNGSILSTGILLLLLAMPVSMLAVGSTYRSDCPLEPRIPIYLLVGGSFGLIKVFLMLWNQKKHSNDACVDDDDDGETDDAVVRRTTKFTEFILSVFLSVWFIMGNVWFYKIWIPNFEQPLHEPSNWCHMTVFRYTFYHLVTCYGLIALVVITTSSFITYYCCKKYHYIK